MKTLARLEIGDQARIVDPLFYNYDSTPSTLESPKQLELMVIPVDRAVLMNELWHSRLPLFGGTARIAYGFAFDGRFYASAIWSQPIARALPQREWLELRRLAIAPDAPKNTATCVLKKMRLDLPSQFPEVIKFISYQDTDVHLGTIYKADNWRMVHTTRGDDWTRPNQVKRTRTHSQSSSIKNRWEYNI